MTIILPFPSVKTFPTLFNQLDDQKASLKIHSYGASVTTMDEIFLNITKEKSDSRISLNQDRRKEILNAIAKETKLLTGFRLFQQQFKGYSYSR